MEMEMTLSYLLTGLCTTLCAAVWRTGRSSRRPRRLGDVRVGYSGRDDEQLRASVETGHDQVATVRRLRTTVRRGRLHVCRRDTDTAHQHHNTAASRWDRPSSLFIFPKR